MFLDVHVQGRKFHNVELLADVAKRRKNEYFEFINKHDVENLVGKEKSDYDILKDKFDESWTKVGNKLKFKRSRCCKKNLTCPKTNKWIKQEPKWRFRCRGCRKNLCTQCVLDRHSFTGKAGEHVIPYVMKYELTDSLKKKIWNLKKRGDNQH